ncbi:MAG: RagB/SusD family nutrient uptake outer membrane protein [Odoribacteraceae bacterium]|jgi:hypothetical protein|nr:RagB/SusD family nutrient uptake outer membrane protein [Odoribacteraceae bacterium]
MKLVYNILIVAAGMLLGGCSDFLERSAQDLVIPKTTAQYKEILQYEGYFQRLVSSNGTYGFVTYMTDDIELFDARTMPNAVASWVNEDSKVEPLSACYQWQENVEGINFVNTNYRYLYNQVMVANICLLSVDDSEGTLEEKEILKGQASFSRAFAYLMLANLYAKPYNKAQPDDLCVPLKDDFTPSLEVKSRATIEQVWNVITEDIEAALKLLEDKKINNIHEISYPAALVLATRIYLYKEDWAKAIECGEKFRALGRYPLHDISAETTSGDIRYTTRNNYADNVRKFLSVGNTEVAWTFGYNYVSGSTDVYRQAYTPSTVSGATGNVCVYYRVSAKDPATGIIWQYATGDRRKVYWFYAPPTPTTGVPTYRYDYITTKYERTVNYLDGCFAFRAGEIYISLAEAYARRGDAGDQAKAIEVLNELRVKRFDPSLYVALQASDFGSDQALVDFIWQERRRELCFEELHRWWDLRRTTQPQIVHQWKNSATYTLEAEDDAYVLQFPRAELDYNGSALEPNPRPNRPQD